VTTPEELQRRYYADTASSYEAMRGGEEEVERVLGYVAALLDLVGARSRRGDPKLTLRRIEPVPELVHEWADEVVALPRGDAGRGWEGWACGLR
jgi:hypothetical protein